MSKVIFLLGPTASGKTALACRLADRFPIELISVDSALVYRDMNIGTAKPDAATLVRYPHRLVDVIDPPESYSAARFCADAKVAIEDIHARGKTPLLVGGTMLYVKALIDGLSDMPPANPEIRKLLDARLQREGLAVLYAELGIADALTAAKLKPADTQRILRALEVFMITGTPISSLQKRDQTNGQTNANANANADKFDYPNLMIGLVPSERAVLHQRIADRFDAMLKAGFIDEVRDLRNRYVLAPDMPSMRAVGYRQTWEFLDGAIDKNQLRETGIVATRQLCKRQLTWLRGMGQVDNRVENFDCLRPDLTEAAAERLQLFLADH